MRADHDPANECLGAGNATMTIRGTAGNDVLMGTPGPDVIKGLAGDDTIDGGGGRDILCGEEGNDVLVGGDDGDSLDGGLGDDRLDGGPGLDLAFFRWSTAPVTANLVTNSATGEGTDTFVALEGLSGSRFNDVLSGDDGDNILDGVGGNDVLLGQGGIDALDGDAGNDVLNGGPGHRLRLLPLRAARDHGQSRLPQGPRLGHGHAARHRGPGRAARTATR